MSLHDPERTSGIEEEIILSGLQILQDDITEQLKVVQGERVKSSNIPKSSPLYPIQVLETGWDGYWAERLSIALLQSAQQVWELIEASNLEGSLPTVSPAANGSIAFSWTHDYPFKELEVWIYERPQFYAEWLLSVQFKDDESGKVHSWAELSEVIKRYQAIPVDLHI